MLDFEVQKFTRMCANTDRELKPGEAFYSYLLREGGETVRCDLAADQWDGPPQQCLAWWKSEVPDPRSKRIHWAPHDVMLHFFTETVEQPGKEDVRYVLALLLVRRRILRLEATESGEAGQEILCLYCSRNETEYQVPVVEIPAERVAEIQGLLSQLLVDVGSK